MGGTAFFSIVLGSQPTANVSVELSSNNAGEGIPSPTVLNFNSANWAAAQTVTVTGVDDAAPDGNQSYQIITAPAVSADKAYNSIDVADVSLINQDNDTPNVLLNQTGGSTSAVEGGATDSYTLVLASEPTANVTVATTPDSQVTVNGSSIAINLIFTTGVCPGPGNWCTAQTVTVAAQNDAIAEGAHTGSVSHVVSSVDPNYNGLPVANISAALTDNDTAGVTIVESGGTTTATEGGAADSYTVKLNTQPTSNVNLTVTPDAQVTANASAVPIVLSFTAGACPGPGDWCNAQTVHVAAVDDALDEGPHTGSITHSFTSADPNYNGSSTITTTITDNDTAAVSITESGGTTAVTEGGATDSYEVRLSTEPTANVTVTVTPDSQVRANGSSIPINLNFTSGTCPGPGNWCTVQTVTVAPVNDSIAEGAHTGSFSHTASSTDPGYNGIAIAGVSAAITDNETAGISVTESGGATTLTESGTNDTYTLVLTSQPSANVTVTVSPNAEVLANSSAAALTLNFTAGACPGPGNWCNPQTITAAAVDDANIEGTHTGSFTHTASSSDATYNGIGVATVTPTIGDNEKYMFRTAAVHNGNFDNDGGLGGNGDGSGIAEADQFCGMDANKPSAHNYKALLVNPKTGPGQRIATLTPNIGDGQVDWILTPNTQYFRADGTTPVFQTGANSLFVFGTATNSIAASGGDYWTGTLGSWQRAGIGLLQICAGWSTNSALINGGVADPLATNSGLISRPGITGVRLCSASAHIVCVQE